MMIFTSKAFIKPLASFLLPFVHVTCAYQNLVWVTYHELQDQGVP
ncbi:hypothetical protein BFJ69_g1212 [Fusarium oxysporum]|uniref:Uncharacterized protein n=1 Tax=Fusarium oxysporum TaxID=5507 RepID=A0A420P146_FUSOX|nr:hypothetical protein BFJ69_g1212 [Fusarium oxysporum]